MRKTPLGGRYVKQLIRVNDQVCFAAFQQWEFTERLNSLTVDSPEEFTTSAFPANPFGQAIYRRVNELLDFSKEAEEIALQMGVIASVEYVRAYIEELQLLREALVPDHMEPIRDDAEEEQLRLKLCRWRGNPPTKGYFRTLGYFRLLRNHYAHVNEAPTPALKAFARSHGTPLNTFWDNGVTDRHQIDFRILALTSLTPDLTFGVMNLLRVCVLHIDAMVAETISPADAIRWIVLHTPRAQQLSVDRLSSKVVKRLRMEWGIEESSSTVTRQVQELAAGT